MANKCNPLIASPVNPNYSPLIALFFSISQYLLPTPTNIACTAMNTNVDKGIKISLFPPVSSPPAKGITLHYRPTATAAG